MAAWSRGGGLSGLGDLLVWRGVLPGLGGLPGPGESAWARWVVSQHALRQTPPVNRMTDRQV